MEIVFLLSTTLAILLAMYSAYVIGKYVAYEEILNDIDRVIKETNKKIKALEKETKLTKKHESKKHTSV